MTVSLGPDGNAVGLWASEPDAATLVGRQPASPSEASFPSVLVEPPVTIRVCVQEPGGRIVSTTSIPGFTFAHPLVGELPGGDLILVGSRCRWSDKGVVPNAGVWSPDGRRMARAVIGDGVASIEVTNRGEIWVGYFDEGIYGNFGWGEPGPRPIGASGLLRLSRSLDLVWRYPADARPAIDDGPSLNVVGDVVWMTHDADYPLVRIADGRPSVWTNETGSASAVLVEGETVALVGRSITTGTLRDGAFHPTGTCDLELLPRPVGFVARGAVLHVFDEQGEWLTTDLATLRRAATPP